MSPLPAETIPATSLRRARAFRRRPPCRVAGLVALLSMVSVRAAAIPDAEVAYAPTPARLAGIHAAAKRDGWGPQVAGLQAAAALAYQREKLPAAEAWHHVARWAQLFAQSEVDFARSWIAAVNAARAGHRNMATPAPRPQPMGSRVSPELQLWLLGTPAFSAEFFGLIAPVDYLPRVFEILHELHQRDAARFKTHAGLALAIAVVYDVPPPDIWPHGQVTAQALPRRFPAPADAFAWWIKQEQNGRLYHRLSRLGADELKFVVDTIAPLPELEWAQQAWSRGLAQLPGAYSTIRYRNDRLTERSPVWPGRSYTLEQILATGGICSDQAYFATQVGKARGVPTILFCGAGNDGRHAWFGYLDGSRKWQLDAGRYAEQRFVTGVARDPQTWTELSDHELQFLTERFRELPAFRQSQVHASFAAEFLAGGNAPAAGAAARKAVSFERRNQPAWETLIAAAQKEGREAKTIENLLREAALALQRHPDLEAHYLNRLADSLRRRGETSAADNEARKLALKNKGARSDLSVQQARTTVQRAIATQPLAGQVRTFNTVLDTQGRGAGIGFFDEVVVGFVEHLLGLGQPAEAARAVERARRTLKVEPNSQLAGEIEELAQRVKRGGKS